MRVILTLLLLMVAATCVAAPPTSSVAINPTTVKWVENWSNADEWSYYGDLGLPASNIGYNATIGNSYEGQGGSPKRKWDRTKPITARARLINDGATWIGFLLYSGEAEYCGFSISSNGTVSYYNNAQYFTAQNSFTATVGQPVELQIEYDGNGTFVFKARNYDASDAAAWTLIGTRTFSLKVDPTIQFSQEPWNTGAKFGQLEVTGSPVWGLTDVADYRYWFPTRRGAGWEAGIEYNDLNPSSIGVQHYLTQAGGMTVAPDSPNWGSGSWIQGTSSTAYSAGDFQAVSPLINPAAGYKYANLQLIGALRGGAAGSTLTIAIRKSDGSLVPSADLGGAANPVAFTNSAAEQKTVDLSGLAYTGVYLEVNGHVTNSTSKLWPDYTGTTGPPILKQASITFAPSGVGDTLVTGCAATFSGNFK